MPPEFSIYKKLNTRLINKHDTETNWNKAQNFIPKQGELIVYDIDDTYSYERVKMGDGTTKVAQLPFLYEAISNDTIDSLFTDATSVQSGDTMINGTAIVEESKITNVLNCDDSDVDENNLNDDFTCGTSTGLEDYKYI